MNKLLLCATLAWLTAFAASVEAKDKKKDKYKDWDNDSRKRSAHYDNRDHDKDRYRNHDRYRTSDRSRTIYVIERERPVKRLVYIDSDGRYYQRHKGQRVYVRERYFESYPSRYYTSSGQRRVSIALPF